MVAYSFNKIFVPQVEGLTKRQTVRAHRKRHARLDEPVQLYTGMRTRHCRKLVSPDPICSKVDHIALEILAQSLRWIEINGIRLRDKELEDFAVADGFAPSWHADNLPRGYTFKGGVMARDLMAIYWAEVHGAGVFEGAVIYWGPAA